MSQDYWIANEDEMRNAEKIIKQGGNCELVACSLCPLNESGFYCEPKHEWRVEICKKMLEE